jgi:hypothetical protein
LDGAVLGFSPRGVREWDYDARLEAEPQFAYLIEEGA